LRHVYSLRPFAAIATLTAFCGESTGGAVRYKGSPMLRESEKQGRPIVRRIGATSIGLVSKWNPRDAKTCAHAPCPRP
jgi:hypothetical protein